MAVKEWAYIMCLTMQKYTAADGSYEIKTWGEFKARFAELQNVTDL